MEELCTCKQCGKEFKYKRDGGSKTLCSACRQKNRADQIKKRAVEYLGGKCKICGYDKSLATLDFHHIDGDTKEFKISGNYNRSWKRIKAELDKCVLLCANCHREIHQSIINLDTKKGQN